MKITVLHGSPRKKDGYRVVKYIEKNMAQKIQIEFEHIHISEMYIENCKGCKLCFNKGEDYCPIKDDVQLIKDKLVESDGLIFISPVYAIGITGAMKNFVDRLSYMFHRPEMAGKPIINIVTTDGGGHKQTLSYLKMTATGWGGKLIGDIAVISPMYFQDSVYHDIDYAKKLDHKLDSCVDEFIKFIGEDTKRVVSLYDKLLFHGLKSKTLTSEVDREYWANKGWMSSYYFYETKENPLFSILGCIVDKIIKRKYKSMYKITN